MTEWQDISTAPKDGSNIILYDGEYVNTGYYDCTYGHWNGHGFGEWQHPTHWMPLPPKPKD